MQMDIKSFQRQSNLSNERINHRNKRTAMLQNLMRNEEAASIAKIQVEEEQENYKYNKQREKLLRETALANKKAKEYTYLSIAQNEHMEAMR
jgi:hypothetical protein